MQYLENKAALNEALERLNWPISLKELSMLENEILAGKMYVQQAMEPLYTTGGDDRSGMGFTIMESFMDKLTVRSAPGRGTTVTMRRRIRQKR